MHCRRQYKFINSIVYIVDRVHGKLAVPISTTLPPSKKLENVMLTLVDTWFKIHLWRTNTLKHIPPQGKQT